MVKFDLFGNSIISAGIDQKPVSPHVWKLWPSYIADGINIAESEKELQVMSDWRWKILHSGNSSVSYSDIMKPNPPLKNPSNKIHLASEEIETNTSLWSGVRLHKILFNVLQFNLNTIRSAAWQFDCGMTNNRAYNRAALIEDGLLPLLQKSEVWLGLGSMIVSNPFPFCALGNHQITWKRATTKSCIKQSRATLDIDANMWRKREREKKKDQGIMYVDLARPQKKRFLPNLKKNY